jgi:5-hydroxyisourate hydrolase
MGRLTTHVLDTAHGKPGRGIVIELYRLGPKLEPAATATTNDDGRCDSPLLSGEELTVGIYRMVFHVGDYFRSLGVELPPTPFLDQVVLQFGVTDPDEHYHVPLLVSPFGYSTYRGS